MATKKSKGLGRGLEALLGGSSDITEEVPVIAGSPSVMAVTDLQAGKYQPRSRMDEGALNELAASIKEQGLLQPILIRPIASHNVMTAMKSSPVNVASVPPRLPA